MAHINTGIAWARVGRSDVGVTVYERRYIVRVCREDGGWCMGVVKTVHAFVVETGGCRLQGCLLSCIYTCRREPRAKHSQYEQQVRDGTRRDNPERIEMKVFPQRVAAPERVVKSVPSWRLHTVLEELVRHEGRHREV